MHYIYINESWWNMLRYTITFNQFGTNIYVIYLSMKQKSKDPGVPFELPELLPHWWIRQEFWKRIILLYFLFDVVFLYEVRNFTRVSVTFYGIFRKDLVILWRRRMECKGSLKNMSFLVHKQKKYFFFQKRVSLLLLILWN